MNHVLAQKRLSGVLCYLMAMWRAIKHEVQWVQRDVPAMGNMLIVIVKSCQLRSLFFLLKGASMLFIMPTL